MGPYAQADLHVRGSMWKVYGYVRDRLRGLQCFQRGITSKIYEGIGDTDRQVREGADYRTTAEKRTQEKNAIICRGDATSQQFPLQQTVRISKTAIRRSATIGTIQSQEVPAPHRPNLVHHPPKIQCPRPRLSRESSCPARSALPPQSRLP